MKFSKQIHIIAIITCIPFYGFTQNLDADVFASAGEHFVSAEGMLSWTLGETVIATYDNEDEVLTQGFHQTYYDEMSVSLNQLPEFDFDINIFPNPTVHELNINTDYHEPLQVEMVDLLGRNVLTTTTMQLQSRLDVSHLPSAIYLLRLKGENGRLFKTFKINKQNN